MAESSSDCRRHAIGEASGAHSESGSKWEAKLSTGTNSENSRPNATPGSVSESGSNLCSASVKIRPSNRKENVQNFKVSRLGPKRRKHARKSEPVRSSTAK